MFAHIFFVHLFLSYFFIKVINPASTKRYTNFNIIYLSIKAAQYTPAILFHIPLLSMRINVTYRALFKSDVNFSSPQFRALVQRDLIKDSATHESGGGMLSSCYGC